MQETIAIMGNETIHSEVLIRRYRIIGIITFLTPFLGTSLAMLLLIKDGKIDLFYIILMAVMYLFTTLGLEVGCHRYLSHQSFKAGKTVRAVLTILGSMAASGPPIYWAATHRLHHKYSDKENDPHSPHAFGDSFIGKIKGTWHAQVGWMLNSQITNPLVMAKSLHLDPDMRRLEKYYLLWILTGLIICMLSGYLYSGTMYGAMLGLLWGGFVRIFFVHMLYIGGLNSICHRFGKRDFDTNDLSRNTWWMFLPTLGEGWHNNHHAFPYSAYLNIKWWQIDISGYFISLLKYLGLIWDVRKPSEHHIKKNMYD
jgi:stearoyl-CoA desaturase (delta-9 desaturase)